MTNENFNQAIKLAAEAKSRTEKLGHNLEDWSLWLNKGSMITSCKDCKKYVEVFFEPARIAGPAVVAACPEPPAH